MSKPGQVTSSTNHPNHETASETNHSLSNLSSKDHQPRKNLIFQRRVLDSLQKVLVAIVKQMALPASLEK